MKITISEGRCLTSKAVKEYINKNFATCKSLCNFEELYTAFSEKHLNVNIVFLKCCALRHKWCVLAGSLCCICLSKFCVASRCNGLGLDTQKTDQINFCLSLIVSIKIICDHFYIPIIYKSNFLTGTSLVHLIWKCFL